MKGGADMNEMREAKAGHLFDLLAELSVDPLKCEALLRDPAKFMAAAGLSPADQAILERRLQGQGSVASPPVRGAFVWDPGDDPDPNPDPMPADPPS
jgi:hypothetical protein